MKSTFEKEQPISDCKSKQILLSVPRKFAHLKSDKLKWEKAKWTLICLLILFMEMSNRQILTLAPIKWKVRKHTLFLNALMNLTLSLFFKKYYIFYWFCGTCIRHIIQKAWKGLQSASHRYFQPLVHLPRYC